MSNILNHLNKACDFKLCRPVIFFSRSENPKKKEKWFDQIAAKLMALRQILISRSMKDHYSKSKLLEGIQVNPQDFVGIVMYES